MSATIGGSPSIAGSGTGGGQPGGGTPSTPPKGGSSAPPQRAGEGSGGGDRPPVDAAPGRTGEGTPPPEPPKKFKRLLKMNGQEREAEASEDELWNAYRHVNSVHEVARKNAEERKALEAERRKDAEAREKRKKDFLAEYREDPNFNPVEFLTDQLHSLLQEQGLDPRDRAVKEAQAEIQRLKEEAQAKEEKQRQAEEEERDRVELQRLGGRFYKVIKEHKLPEHDFILNMLSQEYFAQPDGIELTDEELAKSVLDTTSRVFDDAAERWEGDALLDRFPKLAKKIHAALVARYNQKRQGGTPPPAQPQPPRPAPAPANGEKPLSDREAWAEMERRNGGRRSLRTV